LGSHSFRAKMDHRQTRLRAIGQGASLPSLGECSAYLPRSLWKRDRPSAQKCALLAANAAGQVGT
jgi:hypothetical protein